MYLVMNDPKVGLPHSEIPGSLLVISFPGLFADYHVLLRLLSPRHPPCALIHLIIQPQVIFRLCCSLFTTLRSQIIYSFGFFISPQNSSPVGYVEENISNNVLFFSATQFSCLNWMFPVVRDHYPKTTKNWTYYLSALENSAMFKFLCSL